MYYLNDVFLGEDGYDNSDISDISGGEDFGLDNYEPLFFYPKGDWTDLGNFSVQLTISDETYTEDLFYFCHIHDGMSGRIKVLDSDGNEVGSSDTPALGYD